MRNFKRKVTALVLATALAVTGLEFTAVSTQAETETRPAGLTFVQNEDNSATISWKAVEGASQYKVYEADSRYADYSIETSLESTSYTDMDYDGGYYKVTAVVDGTESEMSEPVSYEIETFGTNTYVFEDTDNKDDIQAELDAAYKVSEAGQFGSDRYAFLFMPSETKYDVTVNVGFYTQVAGLGLSPEDVDITQIQCLARWMTGIKYDGSINYSALCNFWRGVENMSTGTFYTTWAVSQATSMRRMNIYGAAGYLKTYDDQGNETGSYLDPNYGVLNLHDYGGYASGGFLADSKVATYVSSGSQQQWLSRNIESGAYAYDASASNYQSAVWNNVLVGSETSIKSSDWQYGGTNTVVDQTPVVAEKPFLTYNEELGQYGIVVPNVEENTSGVSWDDFTEDDYRYISIDDCYVAKPGQTAEEINAGIADKKGLIFTPGIYELDQAINIDKDDMVVLGLGLATIKPTAGNQCIVVGDVTGVRMAGLLFDAGRVKSEALLTVGSKDNNAGDKEDPIVLSDCYFRVGGADSTPCKTTACVIINTAETICDNFWVWRADHGSGVAWNKNTADYGVIFNGENITAYGLMVEHFQKVQTQWNADGGRCYMYQSELPYDITSQSVWNEEGSYGYTDYKVADNVKTHEGYGIGIYSCYQAAQCRLKSAITCPDTEGVKFTNVCTYSLVGNGTIDSAINDAGYQVASSGSMCRIYSYCNGIVEANGTRESKASGIRPTYITIQGKSSNFDREFTVNYTGKAITRKISINASGINLIEGTDYTVKYSNNTNIGKATITVTGINNYKGTIEYTMNIVMPKTKITNTKVANKKVTLSVKKVSVATGYEVTYSTTKKFTKKTSVTKKITKTTMSFKRNPSKTYYVRVRAYKKIGKKFKYSAYTNVKTIKKTK